MRLIRYISKNNSKLPEKIALLESHPEFNADVRKLRHKFDITKQNIPDQIDRLLWDKDFELDVKSLMTKFSLPDRWEDLLFLYIITGRLRREFDPSGSIILQETGNEQKFYIEVLPETTSRDVAKAFKIISKIWGEKPKKQRGRKNLDRDKKIAELAEQGKTIDEIYRVLIKERHDLDYGNIKTIVSRWNKRAKRPKKKLKTSNEKKLHLRDLL